MEKTIPLEQQYFHLQRHEWVRELPRLRAVSLYRREFEERLLLGETPPTPVSAVLNVLQEAYDKPEVWAVFTQPRAGLGGRDKILMDIFEEYILHKYGNKTDEWRLALSHAWWFPHYYISPNVPQVRSALLKETVFICEDEDATDRPLFPEMSGYPWVQDYERVRRRVRLATQSASVVHQAILIRTALSILREAVGRPEVVEACKVLQDKASSDLQIFRADLLTNTYTEYLRLKYEIPFDIYFLLISYLMKFQEGKYETVEDPKLLEDLMMDRQVSSMGDGAPSYP